MKKTHRLIVKSRTHHSELMNLCHMRKREFKECVESLIDREAITVESYKSTTKTAKAYVLAKEIMDSWEG